MAADPANWGTEIAGNHPEPDDHIHNPDPRRDRKNDKGGTIFTTRGIANLGCLLILAVGLVALLQVPSPCFLAVDLPTDTCRTVFPVPGFLLLPISRHIL